MITIFIILKNILITLLLIISYLLNIFLTIFINNPYTVFFYNTNIILNFKF
jgi:hypothetical protein